MNIEIFREYCLNKEGVTEDFPFDKTTLVFKVGGKIFALADLELFESINLKCDPEKAIDLRERFDEVQPGFHMNKKHWNTVNMGGKLPDGLILELIDHSYHLVFNSLPVRIKIQLKQN